MHNSLKDNVLDAVDIVELIGEFVALKRKGREFIGLCPFHPDRKPSLNVSPTKRIFKCWSCGAGGDAIKFVQLRERVDFREALQSLAKRVGLDSPRHAVNPQANAQREQLLRAVQWASKHFNENLTRHADGQRASEYAERRGLTNNTIERFRIGFAPDLWDDLVAAAQRAGMPADIAESAGLIGTGRQGKRFDRFRNRLMFTICDALGRPVAFGGRTLGDDSAKYLNSPETPLFSKSRILYGLDLARPAIQKASQVVVVEGYMDAVLLAQHGVENVVATLGTALTDAHVKLLRPHAESVVLCFDGDDAGLRAADRAVEIALQRGVEVLVLVLPDNQDPADYVREHGREQFESLLHSATPALEFKWTLTERAIVRSGPRAKSVAIDDFLGFVARAAAAGGIGLSDQGLLVGRLADMLSVPADTVYQMLARARSGIRREAISDTPDSNCTSVYDASVRGVPTAVVSAMEEIFGWIVTDSACRRFADGLFREAVELSPSWSQLAAIVDRVAARSDEFHKADIVAACDDAAVLEMISRVCQRIDSGADASAACESAVKRLASEMDALRMAELRNELRGSDPADKGSEDAFRSFLDMARRQNGSFAAERRVVAAGEV